MSILKSCSPVYIILELQNEGNAFQLFLLMEECLLKYSQESVVEGNGVDH